MNIVGVGFNSQSPHCYQHHLLKQLAKYIPQMRVQADLLGQNLNPVDVQIINVTRYGTCELFAQAQMPHEKTFNVLIVHEMHRAVLPFLKLADLLIYTSPLQEKIGSELLSLKYPSVVLPLPSGDFEVTKKKSGDSFLSLNYALEAQYFEFATGQVLQSKKWDYFKDIQDFHVVFESFAASADEIEQLRQNIENQVQKKVHFYSEKELSRTQIQSLLQKSFCGDYYKYSFPQVDFDATLERRESSLVHQTIVASPILAEMAHAQLLIPELKNTEAYNVVHNLKSTYKDYADLILEKVQSEHAASIVAKQQRFNSVEVDSLADLNVVYGAPLNNKYVFSICFRNQETKIERCIQAIIEQNQSLDFGIVLIDDQSSDKSVDVIINKLKKHPEINACVLYNIKNKRAARNFYNVVHSLTTNPDAVILEMDGDDFLAGPTVLDQVHAVYEQGYLKTNGSYSVFPDNQTTMSPEDVARHHAHVNYNRPWHIDECHAWLSLRTAKRSVLKQIELCYFMDRHTNTWLTDRHDAAVQPRAIEIAESLKKGSCLYMPEVLYRYDLGGDNHDHEQSREDEYLKYFFHIDKIWHPLILSPLY